MSCGECNVISLYGLSCSNNRSVCFVCCVSDSVCELFDETIIFVSMMFVKNLLAVCMLVGMVV